MRHHCSFSILLSHIAHHHERFMKTLTRHQIAKSNMVLDSNKQRPLLKEKREIEMLDTLLTTRNDICLKFFEVPIFF